MYTLLVDKQINSYQNAFKQMQINEAKQPEKINENVIIKGVQAEKNSLSLIFEGIETHKEESLITFSEKVPNYIIEKVMEVLRSEEISLI